MTSPRALPFGGPSESQTLPGKITTVSSLTHQIRTLLESAYSEIWVEGEIADYRAWKTGHLYFTLRDNQAQLKGVMFRSAARQLRFTPEDGMRVVARGRVTVYEPKGDYQIICEHLQPHGVGALQLAFDQLKRKLEGNGLFAAERKRSLPLLPRQIGIVTSVDGAALRDILQVLSRRHPTAHVVIRPVTVQGEGATSQIASAIDELSRENEVDVLIVSRGGGSLEDLWAFNEEAVALAIAGAKVPVICGVGHETDVTISDMVADIRAPTPSAAAEIVVAGRDELINRIDRLAERLRSSTRDRIRQRRTHVLEVEHRPGLAGWPSRLALHSRHAFELTHAMALAIRTNLATHDRHLRTTRLRLAIHEPGRQLETTRTHLLAVHERLVSAFVHRRENLQGQVRDLVGQLDALSPLGVLGRGYAVCWHADRRTILRDSASVSIGEDLAVTLHRGQLTCTVTDKD